MSGGRGAVRHLTAAISAGVLLASLSASGTAQAQPAKPSASASAQDTATAEARARFDEGIKLAEAGDHEAARLKFNQAWALVKSPAILYNLARAEQLSGHPVEALEHWRQFAKVPPDPKVTDAQRQRAAENINELSKKVGQIEVEAPPGARISVDGHAIESGRTDPIAVAPGRHTVEAIADGKVKSVTVECSAGAITKAKLTESSTAAAAPAPPPAPPSAKPPADNDAPDTAAAPADTSAAVSRGSNFWTTGRTVGAAVFGGGVAVLAVGLAFHFVAVSSADEAARLREGLPPPRESACNSPGNEITCAQLDAQVKDQLVQEDLRTGLFIGGGALVVGGAALFLLSSPSKEGDTTRGSARIVPIATGRETGVGLVGRF